MTSDGVANKDFIGAGTAKRYLKQVGERIWNLERIFNLREGIGEDMPAPRLFAENLADGKKGGEAISKARFLQTRAMYYQARGWSEEGVPSSEKLNELALNE